MKAMQSQRCEENQPINLGEHLAEWYEQGERFLLTDSTGREQVHLSREEAYLLLSLLLASFRENQEHVEESL